MKTIRFLWISLIVVLVLCIAVFALLTTYMINQNEKAAEEIGSVYLDQFADQIQLHFESVVDLQVAQFEKLLLEAASATETVNEIDEGATREFVDAADELGFTYLAFCDEAGAYTPISGSITQIDGFETFMSAVISGEQRVTDALDADGNTLLIIGIPVIYTSGSAGLSKNEITDQMMIAGIPIEDIGSVLSINENSTFAYSHIIRKDGTFVLDSLNGKESSCFRRILNGRSVDGTSLDDRVAQLKDAMALNETYSFTISMDGETENVRFTPLPNTEGWYLATVMLQDMISTPVQNLMNQRFYTALVGCGVIVVVVLLVFIQYFRMTRRQLAIAETAQREAESAKQEADEANQAKSQFLSNMSHDIRTPMNAIVGLSSIAASKIDDPQTVKDCLNKITLSSRHLLGLINDVLDMSRIESGQLSLKFDLMSLREMADQMTDIIQPQIRERKQKFDVNIDGLINENVYCDSIRLGQVLLNLLSNAIKFTPDEGSIRLTISQAPSPQGRDYLTTRFVVTDTGMGMSAEFQKHIFDSFAREDTESVNQVEGTGLGMPITKSIVDKMGGSIKIDSVEGEGSTFTVTLDLKPAHEQAADVDLFTANTVPENDNDQLGRGTSDTTAERASATNLAGKHVLVAEDQELNWEVIRELLAPTDVILEWVKNGQECVDRFAASEIGFYDAVLMDVQMPIMNGYKATRAIRTLERPDAKQVPIIAMTADVFSEDIERSLQSGMNAHVSKPIDIKVLIRTLVDSFDANKNNECDNIDCDTPDNHRDAESAGKEHS